MVHYWCTYWQLWSWFLYPVSMCWLSEGDWWYSWVNCRVEWGAGNVTFIVRYNVASVLQMLLVLLFTEFLSLSKFPSPPAWMKYLDTCLQHLVSLYFLWGLRCDYCPADMNKYWVLIISPKTLYMFPKMVLKSFKYYTFFELYTPVLQTLNTSYEHRITLRVRPWLLNNEHRSFSIGLLYVVY